MKAIMTTAPVSRATWKHASSDGQTILILVFMISSLLSIRVGPQDSGPFDTIRI